MICDQCQNEVQERPDGTLPKFCRSCGNNLEFQEKGLSIKGEAGDSKIGARQANIASGATGLPQKLYWEVNVGRTRVCSLPAEVIEALGLAGKGGKVKFVLERGYDQGRGGSYEVIHLEAITEHEDGKSGRKEPLAVPRGRKRTKVQS